MIDVQRDEVVDLHQRDEVVDLHQRDEVVDLHQRKLKAQRIAF